MAKYNNTTPTLLANMDKALTSESPLIPEVGATPILPSMEAMTKSGNRQAVIRPFNISEYEDVLGKGNVNPNLDIEVLNENRAQNQSGWRLISRSAGQLGTTVLGGTITGIGSILNFFPTTYRAISQIWDENAKYKWDRAINEGLGSEWIRQGKSIEEWGRKAMPIYQTKQAQQGGFAGGMGDATWWASMFPTVGSAAASMIPVIGNMKLLNTTGKLFQTINGLGTFGKSLNAVGSTLRNPYTQQVIGTLYGAHLDSMEEIVRGYDEQYQYALDLGFTDEEARRYASVYAAESYNDAWAYGVLFNAIELNSMLRGIKNAPVNNIKIEQGLKKNIKGLAEKGKYYQLDDAVPDLNKKLLTKIGLQKTKDFFAISLSEGFEEMRVDMALNEGVIAAKKELGIEDSTADLSPLARMGRLVEQAQSWDSFIWGAIGGGVMTTGRGLVTKALNGKAEQEYETKRATNIINGIQDTAAAIADADGDMNIKVIEEPAKDENGNQILNSDGTPKVKRTIVDPASEIMTGLMVKMGASNGFKYGIEYFDEVLKLSDEQLAETYGSNKRGLIQSLRREFEIAQRIHNKNIGLTWGNPFDNILRTQASTDEYLLDYYRRQLGIIDTELETFDIQSALLNKKHEEELKAIDSKLHELNVAKIVYQQERDKIQSLINDWKSKSNDKEREKAIRTLSRKIVKINKKSKQIEDQIDIIQSEIDELNNYIKTQAALSSQQPNRKRREPYKFAIKDAKSKISEKQSQIQNARDAINELNLTKLNYEQEILIHQGEISDAKKHIDILKSELSDYNARISQVNSELAEMATKENNNIAEYNKAKKAIKENPNKNNKTYQSLEEARTNISMAVLALEENVNNRDAIMQERSKLLKEVYDKQEEIEKAKKEQEDSNKNKTEVNQESEKVTTDVETDSNGISYSLDDSEAVNSVLFNDKVYSIGSKFNVEESPKTIEKIELVEDPEMDFRSVMITLKDDTTGVTTTISAKELSTKKITPIKDKIESEIDKIYNSLYKLQNELSSDKFKNNYFDVISHLYKELKDNKSDIYKALLVPIDNTELNNLRARLIQQFIAWLETYQPEDISTDNLNKTNEIKTLLRDSNIRITNAIKINQLIDYLWELYGGDIVGYNTEENANLRKILENYILMISKVINNYYNLKNGKITFNDLRYDPNIAKEQIDAITGAFVETLSSNYNPIQYADFYRKVNVFKNTILNQLGESSFDFYKRNVVYLQGLMNKFINKIRTIRQDKNSPLYETFAEKDKFRDQASEIMELAAMVDDLANDFVNTGAIPNLPTRTKIYNLLQSLNKYIVDNIDDLALTDANDIKNIRNSNIIDLLRTAKNIYGILARYYNFETGVSVNDDVRILNSMDILANSVQDFIDDEGSKELYSTNDYRYYISDSMRTALAAIEDTIVKLDMRKVYSDSHVYTFDDILDGLYQQTDGREQVLKYWDSIWYALRYFKHNMNLESVMNQMRKNGVPKEHLEILDKLFKTIETRIANPILTVDQKYIIGGVDLSPRYINQFFKTHTQNEFESNGFRGLRRLNPEIYQILSDPQYYNPRTRVLKNKITINGIEFESKQVFDALQSLKNGQEFVVKYEDGYVNINLEIDGKLLLIERIGVGDSEYYNGIKLGRVSEDDSIQYDSAFGTEYGVSKYIDTIIRKAGNSDEVFNNLKEFYKIYNQALTKEKQNDPEVKEKLLNIIKYLGQYNKAKDAHYSDLVNALIGATQYNTESEGVSPDAFDLNNLDLNKVYYIISPMFYNIRLENLDDYIRYGLRIKTAYQNINKKLNNDFVQSQKLLNEIKEKGSAILVLTGLNKSPITYADDTSYQANVNEEIQHDVISNGETAVNIIQRQPYENVEIVSSLTLDQPFTDPVIEQKLTAPDRHYQIYAEIKSNSGENGKSYIPLRRGNLASKVADTPFNIAAMEFVTQTMSDIITDATMTYLSDSSKTKGVYKLVDDSKGTLTKLHNEKVRTVIEHLSEAIIVDNGNELNPDWFNISSLYENIDPTTGSVTYSKNIDFVTVVRRKNKLGNGISYTNRIRIDYEKSNDTFIPVKISFSRQTIPTNRKIENGRRKLGLTKSPFTAKQANQIGATIEKITKTNREYAVIDLKKKGIDSNTLKDILNSDLVRSLYGNMQRSVTTKWNGDHYTYGIRKNGEYVAVTGKYDSYILNWAKKRGIIDQSTDTTFNSMQDFILNTGALTTSVIGIRNESGEVLSNYTIDAVRPAMFFEMKSEQSDDFIKDIRDVETKMAIKIIDTLSKTTNDTNSSWYDKLSAIAENKELALRSIGVIPENASDEVAKQMVLLYDKIYENLTTNIGIYDFGENESTIKAHANITSNVIEFNSAYLRARDMSINDLGLTITHESLHIFADSVHSDKKVHDKLKPIIESFASDVTTLSVEEFNKKYNSNFDESDYNILSKYINVILKTPSEILTYTFTDKTFAKLMNQIILQEDANLKVKKSVWIKIIDALLEILGITEVNKNSALDKVRTIVINSFGNLGSNKSNRRVSGRPTHSPTGERSEAARPSKRGEQVTTELTNVTNDSNHETLNTASENTTVEKSDPLLDFFLDDDTTDADILNSEDLTIDIETAGRGAGLTPTSTSNSTSFENNIANVLENRKNRVSLQKEYVTNFIDKYIDDNNNKIC